MMSYIPDSRDLVWLNFDPALGREQKGKRPALILTTYEYNNRTKMAVVCPVTSRIKGFNSETILPPKLKVSGVVLCDHVRLVDLKERNIKHIDRLDFNTMTDVIENISILLDFESYI